MHQVLTRSIFVSILLLATACSVAPQKDVAEQNWPPNLPEKAVFEQAYQQHDALHSLQSSENYIMWIKRFYMGWALYPNGWLWMTDNVLDATEDRSEHKEIKQRLFKGGISISTEWAKDRKVRKIDSSNLMTWASALKMAVKQKQQAQITRKIENDVAALISGELVANDIDLDRYFPEDDPVAAQGDENLDDFGEDAFSEEELFDEV